jgi:hypothetical protein
LVETSWWVTSTSIVILIRRMPVVNTDGDGSGGRSANPGSEPSNCLSMPFDGEYGLSNGWLSILLAAGGRH